MRSLLVSLSIVLLLLPSCNFVKKKGWFGTGRAAEAAMQIRMDSIRVADSLARVRAAELELEREQAIQDSLLMLEEEMNYYAYQYRYHIIVGSFITPEYALDHSDFYSSMGYQTQIIEGINGFDLVSAMGLDDYSQSLYQLENFKDTVDIESWLYIFPE